MSIDLDDIARRIADGIYGDDRMTKEGQTDAFSALNEIIAEVERLREQRRIDNEEAARLYDFARDKGKALERAAVVAYLKSLADAAGQADAFWQGVASGNGYAAQMIERGEHRREEER